MNPELIDRIKKAPPLVREAIELQAERILLQHEVEGKGGDLGTREAEFERKKKEAEEAATAINTAIKKVASDGCLDLSKREDYDKAWERLRTRRPDLFPARQ